MRVLPPTFSAIEPETSMTASECVDSDSRVQFCSVVLIASLVGLVSWVMSPTPRPPLSGLNVVSRKPAWSRACPALSVSSSPASACAAPFAASVSDFAVTTIG
jgi:hypothetical protein